jgi:hypothetical protein
MFSQLVQAPPFLDLIGRQTAGGVEKPGNAVWNEVAHR